MKAIGFVGAGDMGRPMAERLIAAGHDISVCDRNADARASFARRGIATSTSPRAVSGGDVIVLMVATDEQLIDVVSGDDGVVAGISPGRRPIVLVMSTCLPRTVFALRDALAPTGARIVDAPVSGGRAKAEEGALSVMLGGENSDIDHVEDVLGELAHSRVRCGPLGSAEVAKLINNMIGLTNMRLMAEALEIARAAGLEAERLLSILDASSGRNALSVDSARPGRLFSDWTETPEMFASLASIVRKDLDHACEVAHDLRIDAPAFDGVRRALTEGAPAEIERWRQLGKWLGHGRAG